MLEESVVYQDILQKGVQQGLQQGVQQGLQRERNLVLRQLERLLGKLPVRTRKQIEGSRIRATGSVRRSSGRVQERA